MDKASSQRCKTSSRVGSLQQLRQQIATRSASQIMSWRWQRKKQPKWITMMACFSTLKVNLSLATSVSVVRRALMDQQRHVICGWPRDAPTVFHGRKMIACQQLKTQAKRRKLKKERACKLSMETMLYNHKVQEDSSVKKIYCFQSKTTKSIITNQRLLGLHL